MRRLLALAVVVVCAAVVVAYQVTRPAQAQGDARVFVPSASFYLDFSPSFRTSLADVYYLAMVQYYGEHVNGDGRLDALPQMVDLVTRLSPRFTRTYFFAAFALVDAREPGVAYEALQRGFEENPQDWEFPAHLGFFVYTYASNRDKARIAAEWYQRAAEIPGRPSYVPRLAAALMAKGGEREKAILMWVQVYANGDKYSRRKAVEGLDRILPAEERARMKALAPLADTMPEAQLRELIAQLLGDSAP